MGRFKNEHDNVIEPISNWLLGQGFEYGSDSGACGEDGWTKVYKIDNGLYYVWITINLVTKRIYIYKEYECGGCIDQAELYIHDEWLSDLDSFIGEIDERLVPWIG